jgi:serine/threonine protein kinase/Flp pilus assembly protein TadD
MLTEGQILKERYEVGRLLKKGGMGAVFEGFDTVLNARVAIKENRVDDPAMRAAFGREAQLLANLRHPSLPGCIDLFSEGETQYFIMEFVEGVDLAALMVERRMWLPNEVVADLAWQMLDVLEYIHGELVLHRDIKLANIKWKDGRAYLLDFGLAYGQTDDMDTIDAARFNWKYRSKRYSPPEQCMRRRTTPASDLYALAATLYYLLTNVEPADAEDRLESVSRGVADPLEDVRVYNPSADEALSRAVMCALSLGADKRPQSAAEMREMIFPEADEPAPRGLRGFLYAAILTAIVAPGVLACLAFVGPKMLRPQPYVPPPTPTPVERIAVPTPSPTPTPAEEAARLLGEAELARQSGDDKGAWDKLEQAVELDSSNPYIYFLVGDILWEAITDNGEGARKAEVEEQADKILSLVRSPRSGRECVARAWANLAKASFDTTHPDRTRARLDRAIADATEALEKYDANSVAALSIRALAAYMKVVRAKSGSPIDEEAASGILKDAEQAVRLAPEYAQAHANLAAIHLNLRHHSQGQARAEHMELARRGFEQAVELMPRPQFYRDLGDVYSAMGDFDKASDSFRAAIEKDDNYYQAYVWLGDVLSKQGRWGEALMNYLEANCRNGDASRESRGYVLMRLGVAYNKLGQFDRAEENFREALRLNPNDAQARKELDHAVSRAGT